MGCSGPDVLSTPSYASGAIMGIFVLISVIIERSIHHLGKHFEKQKMKQLLSALEAMKEELMLLGFISFFLTLFQSSFSGICVPVGQLKLSFLPCNLQELPEVQHLFNSTEAVATETEAAHHRRLLAEESLSNGCSAGKVPFIGVEALHQIHTLIFTLAGVHIIYSLVVMSLAYIKVSRWATWDAEAIKEATTCIASKGAQKADLAHVSDFQKRHAAKAENFLLDWVVRPAKLLKSFLAQCFVKSLYHAVPVTDYKALRVAFTMTHSLPAEFAFHKFLLRNLEADYAHVVGVTPFMWIFVIFFVIFDIPQGHIVYWLPDIFVMIILLVGAKLERVVQVLARDIDVDNMAWHVGAQLKPRDSLFWFKRPGLMLRLMHFTLFTNSFQLASVIFYAWQFGVNSCYFVNRPYTYIRIIISVVLIVYTSWVTLPTYALVSQMGSHYRPTIFGDHVQHHLKGWASRAKGSKEAGSLQGAFKSKAKLIPGDNVSQKKQPEAAASNGDSFAADEEVLKSEMKEMENEGEVVIVVRPSQLDVEEQAGTRATGEGREMNGTKERHNSGHP